MTETTIPRTFSTRSAATRAGISYRQIDYWSRAGLDLGTGHAAGSGSRRTFAELDVEILTVLGRLADLLPSAISDAGAHRGVMPKVALLVKVAAQLKADPSPLRRDFLWASGTGTIHSSPRTGWCVRLDGER